MESENAFPAEFKNSGLSKREYFTIKILQSYIAKNTAIGIDAKIWLAIESADKLIEALNSDKSLET